MKKHIALILSLFLAVACQKKEDPVVVVPVKNPVISTLSGGVLKIQTTDDYKDLITDTILLDSTTTVSTTGTTTSEPVIVPDGTIFRVVSDDLLISSDRADWVKDLLIPAKNGVVKVSVKPNSVPGLYRITIYPVVSDSIDFSKNLNARFFIEVSAGKPFDIKTISAERYEDAAPYNGRKDLNESWLVVANPDQITYLSVGPVSDKYGNLISDGKISMTASEGQIISDNPASIADGYAYFSYRPTTNVNELTVNASLVGVPNVNILRSVSMKLSKPDLQFMDAGDFVGMFDGQTKDVELRVKNVGALPATNLSLIISPPFIVLPEQSDSCKERSTLRSQEICKIRVRYTRQVSLNQPGYLQVIGQPSNFISSTATIPLNVSNVQPAKLVLSESSITFPSVACGLKDTKELYVTNTGSYAATNVNATQPPSTVQGQAPYFRIILPPPDSAPSPNMDDVIDCGNIFPPGRKCRIVLEFQPLSILPASPVTGLINADSVPSLAVSMSGTAVPGQPTGDIPIAFYKPGTNTQTTTMYAQNGQRTTVKIGPIADSCGNPVANGTVVTASVTGGTLSALTTTTNSGMTDLTWNALTKPELLGNQTITVTSNGYSKQATLTFQGVNLSLSGPTELGQIVIEKPKDFTYTLKNTGNVRAENIGFTFTEPLQLVSLGTCAAGVSVNQTCTFTVGARPSMNFDYNSTIFGSSSTPGINTPLLGNILIIGRHKPVITFDAAKYLFNDGLNTATVQRTLTVKNSGPAISYLTSIYTQAPYGVLTNNCPSTLNVNQTCTVVINAPRSSSLGAGYKNVYIDNEVEIAATQTQVAYAELVFGDQVYPTYKKYYCTGPFNVRAVGINNIVTNLPSNTPILLGSSTGKVLFYSDDTCNSKISSAAIAAGTSVSSDFYIRSIAAETNDVSGASGALPTAIRTFTFEDIKNDILTFKPAMAIRNTSCVMCHSNIKGNIVTDFHFEGNRNNFVGVAAPGAGDRVVPGESYWGGWSGVSTSYGSSYIEGKIYAPHIALGDASRNFYQGVLSYWKGQGLYDSTTPTSIPYLADYLNSMLTHRSTGYLNAINPLCNGNGCFYKDARINPRNISVREVKTIFIGAPAPNKITSFLDSLGTHKYYKWDDSTSPELSNFGPQSGGRYWGNIPGTVMECDGDIFVDGPVFLKEVVMKTTNGCRIYATGVVFIQAPDSTGEHYGMDFINEAGNPNSNVQVTSSVGIILGMSTGSMGDRFPHDDPSLGPYISGMIGDAYRINDGGSNLLVDAAAHGNSRKVNFRRLLLNAPRVDSRYQGDFNGVVITTHSIWSLGHFSYFYDSVFDNIPILPFFTPDTFFSVSDCITNGIDQAVIKDSATDYRSCFP